MPDNASHCNTGKNAPTAKQLFGTIDADFPEFKRVWIDITGIESKSSDKAGVDEVGAYLKNFCRKKGFSVREKTFDRSGNYLSVEMNPGAPLPGIAFLAHMDTVHEKGSFGCRPVREEDGYLCGPGVIDCKGGIAIALLVMSTLGKTGYTHRPLRLILSGDEEVSNSLAGPQGPEFIRHQVAGCTAAFNCETAAEGVITVGRKGIARLKATIKGKAAHSGSDYHKGRSAIKEAAYKIIELEKESDSEKTTYNCGMIKGGEAENIVPQHCSFSIETRFVSSNDLSGAMQHVKNVISHSYVEGTETQLEEISRRPPMERTDGNLELFNAVAQTCRKHGLTDVRESFSGGGSDAAYTVQAGVPTVCSVGAVGEGNHTGQEKALLSSLPSQAKMLAAAVVALNDRPSHPRNNRPDRGF